MMRPVSWGPPSITPEKIRKIRRLAADGIPFTTIAWRCRISVTSVRKYADPEYSHTHQQSQETGGDISVPAKMLLSDSPLPEITEEPLVSEVAHAPVVAEHARPTKSSLSLAEKVWIFVLVFITGAIAFAISSAVLDWTFGVIGILGTVCCFILGVVVIKGLK
jgi:hypothetical protein